MTKEIQIGGGLAVIVDDEDFEYLSSFKWHRHSDGGGLLYASTTEYCGLEKKEIDGKIKRIIKTRQIRMHRLLMGMPTCKVDHKNRNPLDNRKENLRLVTDSQSAQNRKLRSDSATGYKGVHWLKHRRKYRVRIKTNEKWIFVGHFDDIKQAAVAYDSKALEFFGEYACLNFPQIAQP